MSEKSNIRRNPFTGAYSWRTMDTEEFTVSEFDEFPGQYGLQLQDRPRSGTVVVTEDETGGSTLVEVTSAPLQGQYRVDYTGGYIFFNSADDALDVTVDYQGGGSVASKENIEALTSSPYAVGDVFVQWPVSASNDKATAFPAAQRPAARFGGTWTQIWDNDAVFFKTEGDFHASETQDSSRTDGKQTQQMVDHYHGMSGTNNAIAGGGAIAAGTDYSANTVTIIGATADGTHSLLTGYENRPQNRIFLLWKRTA